MPLTASPSGDGVSPPLPSPSPGNGNSNDPSHSLPSFAFVIYQLSVLISSLGLTASDAFARQQLLAALSNVLYTSVNLRQLPSSSTAVPVVPASPVTTPSPSPRSPHLQRHPRARTRRHSRRASPSACWPPFSRSPLPLVALGASDVATAPSRAHHPPTVRMPAPSQRPRHHDPPPHWSLRLWR